MPSNFTGALETQGASLYTGERPRMDVTDQITSAGKAAASLGEMLTKDRGEEGLAEFSAGLSDIESGTSRYAAELRNLYLQTQGADEAKIREIEGQIQRITAGQVQGIYSPTAASLQIDNLVKSYSARNPLIAKDIRLMANAAKGNLSQAVNDALGLDPYVKQVIARYDEARKAGKSPALFERMLRAESEHETAKKEADAQVAIGRSTKSDIMKTGTKFVMSGAELKYDQFVDRFEQDIKNGTVPNATQIEGAISNLTQSLYNDVYSFVAEKYGQPDSGLYDMGTDDFKVLMAPIDSAMTNLKTFLTSSDKTPEEKLRLLKLAADTYEQESIINLWKDNGQLGAFLARAKMVGPDFATALLSGQMAFDSQVRHLEASGQNREGAVSVMRSQADALMRTGDVKGAAGLLFAIDNNNPALSATAVVNFVTGGEYKTGNPVFDGRTVAQGITTFTEAPPQVRMQMVGGILENVSWSRLVKTPELSSQVAADKSLYPIALAKATSHVLSTLANSGSSIDGVTFDPLRGVNAFNYKQPIGISKPRADAILELNRTYQNMLRIFGADVAGEWVNALIQPDTQHGLSKTGNFGVPEKKRLSENIAMGDTMRHVIDINEKSFGLPEELVLALGFRESTLGKNLTSNTSTAAGPLAIIDDTFNTINKRYFEGQLDPNNMYDRGTAALANLAEVYERNNGDLTKTLLEHFSGKPDGWNVVDANGVSGTQFVTEVFQLMKKYRNG